MSGSARADLSDGRMWDREGRRAEASLWSAISEKGMVASAHYRATQAGVEMLEVGGNAVDAAVATSLALAVVESAGSGIGGMAIMTIHLAGSSRGAGSHRTFVLPGPCRAPKRATPELVAGSQRYTGYRAVAVPTYLSVMETALRRYGTKSESEVLAPAIQLAETGFPLTRMQSSLISEYASALSKTTASPYFLDAENRPFEPGTPFRQPELAATLRRLSAAGLRDFYQGGIAREISRDMEAHDGFIQADDLAEVPDPVEQEPVTTRFRDYLLHAAGPPAGGRTLLELLNLFSLMAHEDFDPDSPEGVEILAAVIERARKDRRRFRMQSTDSPRYWEMKYAREAAAEIREGLGLGETSHICIMDAEGNAVSLTQSIERSFGAKVVTPGLGFLYNGYIKAFKIVAKKHPHYLEPGAVARSNAAPAIAVRDGRAHISVGSTGSERMLSGIFQVLVRLGSQDPFASVHAPRLHATPQRFLLIEGDRFDPACVERLRRRGYEIQNLEPYSFKFGGLHLAVFDGNRFHGVAEPRRDGAAAGPA